MQLSASEQPSCPFTEQEIPASLSGGSLCVLLFKLPACWSHMTFTDPPEDPSSISSTYIRWFTSTWTSAPGDPTPLTSVDTYSLKCVASRFNYPALNLGTDTYPENIELAGENHRHTSAQFQLALFAQLLAIIKLLWLVCPSQYSLSQHPKSVLNFSCSVTFSPSSTVPTTCL